MTVIVTALQLPYTVEYIIDEQLTSLMAEYNLTETNDSILATPRTKATPPATEVPFEFKASDSAMARPKLRRNDTAPSKSIVDTRKQIDKNTPVTMKINVAKKKKVFPDIKVFGGGISNNGILRDVALQRVRSNAATGSRGRRMSISDKEYFTDREWTVVRQRGGNGSLYNAIARAESHKIIDKVKWVGCFGMPSDSIARDVKNTMAHKLREKNCWPVFPTDDQRQGHYDFYCKEFLWPTFHSQIPDFPTSKAYEDYSWGDYCAVNQAVANQVVAVYQPGDVIWVHDYHLMLVPQMIRQKLPNAPLAFFLHVAFPTSEVFRCLAYRSELLEGVLASNSIGFQTEEYAEHFMMTATRILAVDTNNGVIETEYRDVSIVVCPMGADLEALDGYLASEAVQSHRKLLRDRWQSLKIIASRDKVDQIRGIVPKLKAFEKYLEENPDQAHKVILIQICIPSSGTESEADELASIANKINSKYGDISASIQPVVLLRQDILHEQYIALLAEADGFAITCLREGMNVTSHEYIYCNDKNRKGPLILSEFTGSAAIFGNNALLVNPWDRRQLVAAFKEMIDMSQSDRARRTESLRAFIANHSCASWVYVLLNDIKQSWKENISLKFSKPDIPDLVHRYQLAGDRSRVFILDIGNVGSVMRGNVNIPPILARNSHKFPHQPQYFTSRLIFVLRALSADPQNIIYLISMESRRHMEQVYRQLPTLGLVAECGRYIRRAGGCEKWETIEEELDTRWQDEILPVIKKLENGKFLKSVIISDLMIRVQFVNSEAKEKPRELSVMGEFTSVISDIFAQHGVRYRVEDWELLIYTDQLSRFGTRALEQLLDSVSGQIGFLFFANRYAGLLTGDAVYYCIDSQRACSKAADVVAVSIGKHPSSAHCAVEGVNSLLTLLEKICDA